MYLEKQKQPTTKDQRLHTRMKCRLTIELHPQGSTAPIFGNLIDISLGGCYVETAAILTPGSNVKVVFSMDKVDLSAEGSVARMHPGSGIAIQFKEMSRDSREQMYRILEFVQSSTTMYNDRYLQNLFNR
jgi:c-di-GMP-binding flagellar brake protein YcgR